MSANSPNRVFITGLSALTACGETLDQSWQALMAGQTGIGEIQQWDLSTWPARLGGELKGFQPARMLPDKKLLKVISKQDVMGINAAVQAVSHSQMIPYRDSLNEAELQAYNEDTAVFVGSPGNKFYQQYDFLKLLADSQADMKAFAGKLFDEVHPMWLLRILPNNVLAYTGITYGFKGANHNVANHAVGGSQALIEAYHAIRTNQAERAVVVAYDVGIEPQALFYYDRLGVLSHRHLSPFDKEHDGTILAEGACSLILESEASVMARQGQRYAEVIGGFSSSERAGLFSIEEEGQALKQLIQKTLDGLQLTPDVFDMIVAHGNGNTKSDYSEAQALAEVFGPGGEKISCPVTAFKWATGHTLCASGLLDAVLAAYSLKNRCVPGIASLKEVAPRCQALNLSPSTRPLGDKPHLQHALLLSRGFGSMNATMVLAACDD